MTRESEGRDTASIELEVEIEASTRAVWHALTDPEKLTNWFAPRVEGSPGEGAELAFGWTEGEEHRATVDVWEPEERVRWSGWGDKATAEVAPATTDFYLRGEGQSTVLKLVSSGLGDGEERTEHFDAIKGRWIYFLYTLKYWLEGHPGARRRMIADRRRAKEPREKAWQRIFGRLGLGVQPRPEELGPGDRFSCQLAEGVELEGKARFINPPIHFAGSIDSVPGALLFVELEPGDEIWHCGFWVSTYDVDDGTLDRLKQGLIGVVDRLFGPETRNT